MANLAQKKKPYTIDPMN